MRRTQRNRQWKASSKDRSTRILHSKDTRLNGYRWQIRPLVRFMSGETFFSPLFNERELFLILHQTAFGYLVVWWMPSVVFQPVSTAEIVIKPVRPRSLPSLEKCGVLKYNILESSFSEIRNTHRNIRQQLLAVPRTIHLRFMEAISVRRITMPKCVLVRMKPNRKEWSYDPRRDRNLISENEVGMDKRMRQRASANDLHSSQECA